MKCVFWILSFILSFPAFADVNKHTAFLEQKINDEQRKIISEIDKEQTRQRTRLSIQLKIDSLRAKIGSETDTTKKNELDKQLKQLQSQRNNL